MVLAAGALGVWLAVPSLVLGLVVVAVLGGLTTHECAGADTRHVGRRPWSNEQTANARLIISTVISKGLSRRAAVVALATAIAESGLRNLHAGDRDSLGLFQQRPSQGWGRPADILNPTYAVNQFLTHLLALPGWAAMKAGVAEQLIQRSAHPGSYAPHEPAAADLVARYWTTSNPTTSPDSDPPLRLAAFGISSCPSLTTDEPVGSGTGSVPPVDARAHAALTFALAQRGKPYVWGAAGPNEFDCSGLVQAAWAAAGIPIGRTTSTQVHDGSAVATLDQLQPGDLLFIPGDDGTPAHPRHVGLYTGDGLVIDAYDSKTGIVIEPLSKWAPKIAAIRRITAPHTPPGRR